MDPEPRQQDPPEPAGADRGTRRWLERVLPALRRADANRGLVQATRAAREALLPGDARFGDPLSTAGGDISQTIARHLAEAGGGNPSATRELGLSALQVWQALSEAAGRGRGTEDVAILFTDLVRFSQWALEAGDELALELLREVALVCEPAIEEHDGRVVKRLGDGYMAVFAEAAGAVAAAFDMQGRLSSVTVDGHTPAMRAGVHLGRPRRLGADYLGVDVNIAARVAGAARGGEVLLSEIALETLDTSCMRVRRRHFFRAKGAPRDLAVYAVAPLR